MTHRIVAVPLDGSPQPDDRLVVPAKVDVGDADKHLPIEGECIAWTEPEGLLDVAFGLLNATNHRFEHADRCLSVGQIPIERKGPLAFRNSLLDTMGDP